MNFLKNLSTRYYSDAKTLNYTWMDLLKRTTRDKVINKVINNRMTKAINKAKRDSLEQIIKNAKFDKKKRQNQ